ncbi:MAG TPA: winged helix-turn-helix domain-containing protein [Terriglobales bacterium]|nr:winged helix-turn-helix domain-containing protein [Terriglobales bacterium]
MSPRQIFQFGDFQVDPLSRTLRRQEDVVTLSRRAFDVLLYLVQNPGRVVTRDELLKNAWPDSFVDENSLAQSISALRRALDEKPGDNNYIATLPGRGYQFVSPVQVVPEGSTSAESLTGYGNLAIAPNESAASGLPGILMQRETIRTSITTQEDRLLNLPTPRRSWAKIGIVAVALMAGSIVAGYAIWRKSRPQGAAVSGRVMLAVLPFQNLTGDPEQEYFADGLTEEMITKLSQLHPERLGVIARTSVMGYKHGNKRLDEIGRELSVQYVLEGSFRRTADRLRITAQLIRVRDQSHLWAEDYDSEPSDILSVQDGVALAVAREIQLRLTPQQKTSLASVRTISPEAHEAYLKGRFFWNQRTEDGFRKAIEYFQAAIAKDPNYAQAYAGLADAYILQAGYGFVPEKDAMPKAKEAALHALSIDDRIAEAYTSLALISVQYEWKWAEAEKNFKRALELNPNYSIAHHWYGDGYLVGIGRTDEGIAELRKALELDPLSLMIATDLAKWLCFTGKFDEGMKLFQKVFEVDPDFTEAHILLAEAYEVRGMYSEAVAELKKIKSPDVHGFVKSQLGRAYALQGKRGEALEIVAEMRRRYQRDYVDPAPIAYIYIALGDKDSAFVWLEKAYAQHRSEMDGLRTDWVYEPIRSDPRFADLVRRVGVP